MDGPRSFHGQASIYRPCLLTRETEYEFRDQIRQRRGNERLNILPNSRIEVYCAEFRGTFSASLPPPK
jgi:hypothetical protein